MASSETLVDTDAIRLSSSEPVTFIDAESSDFARKLAKATLAGSLGGMLSIPAAKVSIRFDEDRR